MSHSKTAWIAGGTILSGTLIGLGLLLYGDLNEEGVREGGFLTPTAYTIMTRHHKFTQADEQELKELAKQNPQVWKEVSEKIKEIPRMPLHKRMDVLYPIYRGKNAKFPKKIIGSGGNGYYLDLSYNIPFEINPYCFYISPSFKEMVGENDWLDWQISCAQSIIQIGTLYGKAWEQPFPVSDEKSQQMQETLKKQIKGGNLSWYKELFPFGYVMNELNDYHFYFPSNKMDWSSRAAKRTKYSKVMFEPSEFAPYRLNGEIIGKMENGNILSIQNGKESFLFFGRYNEEFFQRLSMKIVQMSKESPEIPPALSKYTETVKEMEEWAKVNENQLGKFIDIGNEYPEFKYGKRHLGQIHD